MGLLLKGALLLVAVLVAGSLWEVSALIFAYLLVPLLLRRNRSGGGGVQKGTGSWTKVVGAALIGLAGIGVAAGGRFSPLAFAIPGAVLLVPASWVPALGGARPVRHSILLRGAFVPFRWYAAAELKVATRDPARALSGVEETLLVRHSPSFSVSVVLRVAALTASGAEKRAVARMRSLADRLTPLGVYVLPVDSRPASDLCTLPPKAWGRASLQKETLDGVALLVDAKSGEVAAYDLFAGKGAPGSALGRPGRRPAGRVFLAEVLRASFEAEGTGTDDFTSFLAGVAATSGETAGERLMELEARGDEVVVGAPGCPRVSLTRAQLAAIVGVYP